MINDLITIDFAAVLCIAFMAVFLRQNRRIEKSTKNKFYQLICLELVEIFSYSAELVTASFPYRTIRRILFSIIGYSIRPLLIYIILMILLRNAFDNVKKRLLIIPAIINILIVSTALYSDIAFGYNANNEFYRGTMGYCTHFILGLYLIFLIAYTVMKSFKEKSFEQAIIYLMAFIIIASVVIEAVFSIRSIGRSAMVMCTVFYYMYFQTQEYDEELKKSKLRIEGLSTKVNYDPMTKLLNKEAFRDYCTKSFADNQMDSLGFLFIDIDYFKQLNDTLGHLIGDEAIINIASQLKKAFRNDDLLCRFGGDEFCVCMRKVSFEDLKVKAEYISKNLKQEYWNGNHTKKISVTCSIGAVYYENCIDIDYEKLTVSADRVVYKAKNDGRNRAIVERA